MALVSVTVSQDQRMGSSDIFNTFLHTAQQVMSTAHSNLLSLNSSYTHFFHE